MGWGGGGSSYVVCATHCLVGCFIFIGFTRGAEGQCDSSSCGDLQIIYPFRLKGDPAFCGDPNYELTCSRGDNRTFMEFASIQYLVNQIDYRSKLIHVIDVAVLSNNCSLPFKFLPSNSIDMPYYRFGTYDHHVRTYFRPIEDYKWVSIMKCSKKLASERYQLFPCQTTNDSYVYGVVGNNVANLAPSCSFLSWIPTNYDSFSPKDIFQVIQEGFYLSWKNRDYFCGPSSCGDLQIIYPFYLKEEACGAPNYELTCSRGDNRTFMEFASNQYLVKQINYASKLIQVVDVGLLSSNCSLPLKFLPSNSLGMPHFPFGTYNTSVSIMKCSKKIAPEGYQLSPCQTTNDSYLYGVVGNGVASLAPSCSFLTWMPTIYDSLSPKDIFQVIQDGFFLSWEIPVLNRSLSMAISDCLGNFYWELMFKHYGSFENIIIAVLEAEASFPACVRSSYTGVIRHERLIFRLIISIIVIIDIVLILTIWVLACRFVFAPLSLCIFVAHKFWSNWAQEDAVEKFLRIQQSLSPTRYAYTDIIAITRNFRERLGRGGFGAVYKGELPGNHFIAVKLLAENSKLNGDDFINEVSTIGRIHHVNVVRLVGFCSDGSKRALIYEYMPNGSLEKYIFSSDKTPNHYFSWKKLNSIALGVARGINYLHRGCDMTILHFDIKPQNILLDNKFRPKIADFGLAKLYPKDQNVVSISVARGTIGYIAPELVSRSFGLISHKSDVYSFGMLLLEMGAGRRNVDNNASRSSQVYNPSLVYDRLNNINAMEGGIGIEYGPEMNEVEKKLYIVGFCCIQMRPSDRPSMSDVVEMLDGNGDALQLPPKPFFSSSPSISIAPHFEITATTELTVIDEDDSSVDEDGGSVDEHGSS